MSTRQVRQERYEAVVKKFETEDLEGWEAELFVFFHPAAHNRKRRADVVHIDAATKQREYRLRKAA